MRITNGILTSIINSKNIEIALLFIGRFDIDNIRHIISIDFTELFIHILNSKTINALDINYEVIRRLNINMVQLLLDRGEFIVIPNIIDEVLKSGYGYSDNKKIEMIKLLLDNGANTTSSTFEHAIAINSTELYEILLYYNTEISVELFDVMYTHYRDILQKRELLVVLRLVVLSSFVVNINNLYIVNRFDEYLPAGSYI